MSKTIKIILGGGVILGILALAIFEFGAIKITINPQIERPDTAEICRIYQEGAVEGQQQTLKTINKNIEDSGEQQIGNLTLIKKPKE